MPKIPRVIIPGPFEFSFYSLDCQEPMHVHVKYQDRSCKVWLDSLEVTQNKGLKPHHTREIKRIVKKYMKEIKEVWNEHCCEEEAD